MVEKVTVNPDDVRGLGNVVIPKSLQDYWVKDSSLVEDSEVIENYVLHCLSLGYLAGSNLTYNGSKWITPSGESFSVSVTLRVNGASSRISSASVKCVVNDATTLTATTDSDGVATFSIPITSGLCEYKLLFKYEGTSSVAGCFIPVMVHTGADTGMELDLTGNKEIIQADEHSVLVASLTGLDCNGETVGVQGQTIYFYEEYVLGVRLTGSASIIQSGETSVLTGQLIDTGDGSLVRKSGETVYFYNITDNGLLINDPTEHTITGSTYTTLYEIGDLAHRANWKLSFDFKANAESRLFIGDKNGLAQNPNNTLFVGTPNGTNKTYYGDRDTSTHSTDISSSDPTSYRRMSIEQRDTLIVYTIAGTEYERFNPYALVNYSVIVIGLTIWGSDDTKSVNVKNLKFEVI